MKFRVRLWFAKFSHGHFALAKPHSLLSTVIPLSTVAAVSEVVRKVVSNDMGLVRRKQLKFLVSWTGPTRPPAITSDVTRRQEELWEHFTTKESLFWKRAAVKQSPNVYFQIVPWPSFSTSISWIPPLYRGVAYLHLQNMNFSTKVQKILRHAKKKKIIKK